jgi:hypothetical protein
MRVSRTDLGHKIDPCEPSQLAPASLPWSSIASFKKKASTQPVHATDVHAAAGHPARTTSGLAPAAMGGTHSIREVCAGRAFISGPRRSAFRAPIGRHILTGTLSNHGFAATIMKSCILYIRCHTTSEIAARPRRIKQMRAPVEVQGQNFRRGSLGK